jgi:CheY-like chemotaxis protein
MDGNSRTAAGARTANLLSILVIDDNRAEAIILTEVMKNLRCRYELRFVWDGVEALDFLHGRGAFAEAPRPNLILLDVNMPRLGGLETLSAIKSDPELYAIPVIVFSSSIAPDDVRRSYQAHANCYVQKPNDLERFVKLVQSVEDFWMDFAILPAGDEHPSKDRQLKDSKRENYISDALPNSIEAGHPIALNSGEARRRAMHDSTGEKITTPARKSGCEEHDRLMSEFGAAVREILALHEQQFQAIVDGDVESSRFDLLIHMANECKHRAKYAYLRHVESHGCSKLDANQTRT